MHIDINIRPAFQEDSLNYEVLRECAEAIKGIPGLTCEIGLRRGGGSHHILQGLIASDQKDRTHVAIDPYGNIVYKHDDYTDILRSDYTNTMRDECLCNMHLFAAQNKLNFVFFNMEDSEFFKRYADGVPVYTEEKRIINEYALVHLDGPHTLEVVDNELSFFVPRMPSGGHIICDDVGHYPHEVIDEKLLADGLFTRTHQTDRKWAYRKA